MGRFDRATERLKRAIDRDPLRSALHHNLAIAYLAMGRNGEAENSARRALDLLPTASGRHKGLASTLIVQRKLPEAERVIALEVDEFWRLYGLSLIHLAQGRQREADATLKAFTDKFADIGAYQVAEIYALREEPDSAFQWLERAYRQRDTGLAEMLQSPLLAKVKPDPRYAALLRKLGLPNPA